MAYTKDWYIPAWEIALGSSLSSLALVALPLKSWRTRTNSAINVCLPPDPSTEPTKKKYIVPVTKATLFLASATRTKGKRKIIFWVTYLSRPYKKTNKNSKAQSAICFLVIETSLCLWWHETLGFRKQTLIMWSRRTTRLSLIEICDIPRRCKNNLQLAPATSFSITFQWKYHKSLCEVPNIQGTSHGLESLKVFESVLQRGKKVSPR